VPCPCWHSDRVRELGVLYGPGMHDAEHSACQAVVLMHHRRSACTRTRCCTPCMGLAFGLQAMAWSCPVLPVVWFACIALCMPALQAQKVCHLQDIVWWQLGTNITVYQRGSVSVAAHNGILRCRAAQCVMCMWKHRGCLCVSVVRVPRHGLADGSAGVQVGLVSSNCWAVCWGSHCGWT
jgi:hypothetical protein